MQQLSTLVWISLVAIMFGCKHEVSETPQKTLTTKLSGNLCYEQDTIHIQVFLGEEIFTGNVTWNNINVSKFNNEYLLIAPTVYSDTASVQLTASAGNQKCSQTIIVTKRAFKYPAVSYTTIIQPLLTGNCNFSGCHANGSHAGKIELSVYDSVMKSVVPYNATASLLYASLIKTDPLRIMPPAGKLHDYKIEEVKLWIEQGAKPY